MKATGCTPRRPLCLLVPRFNQSIGPPPYSQLSSFSRRPRRTNTHVHVEQGGGGTPHESAKGAPTRLALLAILSHSFISFPSLHLCFFFLCVNVECTSLRNHSTGWTAPRQQLHAHAQQRTQLACFSHTSAVAVATRAERVREALMLAARFRSGSIALRLPFDLVPGPAPLRLATACRSVLPVCTPPLGGLGNCHVLRRSLIHAHINGRLLVCPSPSPFVTSTRARATASGTMPAKQKGKQAAKSEAAKASASATVRACSPLTLAGRGAHSWSSHGRAPAGHQSLQQRWRPS